MPELALVLLKHLRDGRLVPLVERVDLGGNSILLKMSQRYSRNSSQKPNLNMRHVPTTDSLNFFSIIFEIFFMNIFVNFFVKILCEDFKLY